MPRQVTVSLFDVIAGEDTPRLSETIERYEHLPLSRRWRDDIRLDNVQRDRVENHALVMLDFAKKREIGPGKLTNLSAIEAIHMDGDEDFGEETAACYVPSKKWLLLLHNQSGVGPNRMMGYFNAIDPGRDHYDYEAAPVIDPTVMRQLRRMRNVTSIEVTATVDALNASERELGVSMARAARPAGAQRVSFSLIANERYKKGHFLEARTVKDFMSHMRGSTENSVTALKVKGEDPELDRDVMIDLIHHRLKRKYREDELQIVEKRFTIESRWQLLARAFRSWNTA